MALAGPGFASPVHVVTSRPPGPLARRLAAVPGVVSVSAPVRSMDGTHWLGDARIEAQAESTPAEDPTSHPLKEAGCFFPSDPWKENRLMMPSESSPGSRTGEGHGMLLQARQFESSKIFSQLRGGKPCTM